MRDSDSLRRLLDEDPAEVFLREGKPIFNYIRKLRIGRRPKLHHADNDNNPSRVTRMVPHNGGCSTTSGKVPVTLPRLSCLGEELAVAA